MIVLAIDPGNERSAFVLYDGTRPLDFGKVANRDLLARLADFRVAADRMAIEWIASYGMPVGAEVFDTCAWAGKFELAWETLGGREPARVFRREVKLHLCGSPRAKDGNVIQALKDRFGGKGTKQAPGTLYGFKADAWQALGVAVTYSDTESLLRAKSQATHSCEASP